MTPGEELLFLALGGSGEIGMNANLYGCRGKWILVDLGMTFSDPAYPGIDLVFPDMTFIEERAEDLLGIVLTHGHEDHIGAIPYLAEELGVPMFATPFTASLIAGKLQEHGLQDELELNIVEMGQSVELGPFQIRYIPLAHSIAEGNALLIDTPFGKVFHTGDWKLDDAPIIGEPATELQLREIGDAGVKAMVCDSTNVFNPLASGSEGDVRDSLVDTIAAQKGKRVVVTTFASNIARLVSLGEAAKLTGRRLAVAGRSLDRMIDYATQHGYLDDFPELVHLDDAMNVPRGELLVLATGGQGEPRAALSRIAEGNHPIKLEAGDAVLFSSRQIPGNELSIGAVQNSLAAQGIDMVTDRQADIHVSGHPGKPELMAMYDWIRPEILIPVHGEERHMREQARLARSCGIESVVSQRNGDVVRLAPGKAGIVAHEQVGRLVLDGDVIVASDGVSVTERRRLAYNGTATVSVVLDRSGQLAADPQIVIMGLPLEDDREECLAELLQDVEEAVAASRKRDAKNDVQEAVRLAARRCLSRWTGKRPQVMVMVSMTGRAAA